MSFTSRSVLGVLAVLIAAPAGYAATVASFRNGAPAPFVGGVYDGTEETILFVNNGFGQTDQSLGGRVNVEVGERRDPNLPLPFLRHGLIRFDVTPLAGRFQSIDRVTLRLFVTDTAALREDTDIEGAGVLQVFRFADANAGWVEGDEPSGGGDPTPDNGLSTWDARVQGSEPWAGSPGASTPGVDYLTPLLASRPFDNADQDVLRGAAFDLELNDPSLVADWATGVNAGLFLRVEDELDNAISFFSSEAVSLDVRPELIVEFTAIPEPSSLLLSAAAAFAAAFRRKPKTPCRGW